MSKSSNTSSGQTNEAESHAIEWLLGSISAFVVLGILAFLVAEGLSRKGGVPQLELRPVRQVAQPGGTGIVVEVYNRGAATAADVEISGTVEGLSSTRRMTLDYAPADSVREVTLVFPEYVTIGATTFEVLGYSNP